MKRAILYFFISACVLSIHAQVQKATTGSSELSPVDSYHYTEVQNGESMVIVRESNPQERQTVLASKASNLSVYKTASVTAGALRTALTASELNTVTNLTLTGTLNARDFRIMRDSMPLLYELDFKGTNVMEYVGTDGTINGTSTDYPANEIPTDAFYNPAKTIGSSTITTVSMSLSVTSIGVNAFQYCFNLSSINIPSTVLSIKADAFVNCNMLSSLYIPSSVISIDYSSFTACSLFITVDPGNLNFSSLDGVLFDKYQTLLIYFPMRRSGSYTIPSTVTKIGTEAFFANDALTSVTIPSSVTTLGNQAFSYCRALTSVFVPSTVTTMGSYVFLSSLCSITVEESNPNYSSADGLLFNKNKNTLIQAPTSLNGNYVIPSTVTSLGYMAFQDCKGLTSITIPTSIHQIVYYAFNNCTGLTTLTIPASVNSISTSAFYNCSSLTSIYAMPVTPVNITSSSNVFYKVDKTNCTLYVPTGSKSLYAAANQWSDFTNIVEMTTGLTNETTTPIGLYPNPVTDGFRLNGFVGSCQLMLSDVSGKMVFSKRVNADEFVSLDMLPKGVYTVKLTNTEGTVERKVMKK